MPPRAVLKTHTSRDITEWMAYLSENPQGEHRADFRAGIVAAVIRNAIWDVAPIKRKPKAKQPSDYMPFMKKRRGKITDPEEMVNLLKAIYPPGKK
jgi:hypothetical protein